MSAKRLWRAGFLLLGWAVLVPLRLLSQALLAKDGVAFTFASCLLRVGFTSLPPSGCCFCLGNLGTERRISASPDSARVSAESSMRLWPW